MSSNRVGRLLVGLGVLVGCATSAGLLLGFEPARLPPALLNIAVYKLTFLAAAGLLAVGATIQRYARRDATRTAVTYSPSRTTTTPAIGGDADASSAVGRTLVLRDEPVLAPRTGVDATVAQLQQPRMEADDREPTRRGIPSQRAAHAVDRRGADGTAP